jgi:gliding motility-associated-like protein
LPVNTIFLSNTTCASSEAGVFSDTLTNVYGCDSIIHHIVSLLPGDSTYISVHTCFPQEVGTTYTVLSNQVGCDSVVTEVTALYELPTMDIQLLSDYNGFGVSCLGNDDGSLQAIGIGVAPLVYTWSSGDTGALLTGLEAGNYAVTMIDGNGCEVINSFMLTAPDPVTIGLQIAHPDCFSSGHGSLLIETQGGVEPMRYSLDGVQFQSSPEFDQLQGGMYSIVVVDANGCSANEVLLLNTPLIVSVDVGDDQTIFIGDSAIVNAVTNVPFDALASIDWTGLQDALCDTCLSQVVHPIITTTYAITVASIDGCIASDSLTVFLDHETSIYVPNVFSPNGDQVNDRLIVFAEVHISSIAAFTIFDRWGNLVYQEHHFPPNDPQYGWDGTMNGKGFDPAVFTYKLEVVVNGERQVSYGNVTLLY